MNIYWQKSAIAPSATAIILLNGHATHNEGNVTASLSSWYILTADQDCFAWKAQHDIHINTKCPYAGPQMSDVMKSYYLER